MYDSMILWFITLHFQPPIPNIITYSCYWWTCVEEHQPAFIGRSLQTLPLQKNCQMSKSACLAGTSLFSSFTCSCRSPLAHSGFLLHHLRLEAFAGKGNGMTDGLLHSSDSPVVVVGWKDARWVVLPYDACHQPQSVKRGFLVGTMVWYLMTATFGCPAVTKYWIMFR